jgi:hypothetical protein
VPVKEPEPIYREPVKIKEKKEVRLSELNYILENYFFKEKYIITLEQLKEFLDKSDNNYEMAKSRLFIGRTLIELGKYREAVDYLILSDVKEKFPDESEFWTQYALARIR